MFVFVYCVLIVTYLVRLLLCVVCCMLMRIVDWLLDVVC